MTAIAPPTAPAARTKRDPKWKRPVSFTPPAYVVIQMSATNTSSHPKRGSVVRL